MNYCSIDGCEILLDRYSVRGICKKHYQKEYRLLHKDNLYKRYGEHYRTLYNIKSRCLNPKANAYYRYGGRGITICDRWLGKDGLKNFSEDMGERPSPKHSVDRINNNGNYEPGNCRWATVKEQGANRGY